MKCPSCKITLTRATYANANVHQCSGCYGLLLPKHRASKIQRRVDKDIASLASEIENAATGDCTSEIRCPKCRDKMVKASVEALDFFVDECGNCDTAWYDAGELAQLQLAFESKSQTMELNARRERQRNMTDQERSEYERRIAEFPERGSPMQQALSEAALELAARYYFRSGW